MTTSAPYLGKPGSMVQLFPPDRGRSSAPSRGEQVHSLSGGGSAVTRRLQARRSFSMSWTDLPEYWADTLRGFYLGLYDDPVGTDFVFVDSTVRNVLGFDATTCAARSQAPVEWTGSSGTVTGAQTGSPVVGSGVVTWAGFSTSATLTSGPVTPDVAKVPVYLPAEPVTASVWVKASAASTFSWRIYGYTTAGAVVTNQAVAVSATTSWQQASVTVPAAASGFATAAFVRPVLVATSTPASVSIAAAQLEYATTASTWQPGFGTPRVVITSSVGRNVNLIGLSDHTLTLAER